MVLPTLEPSAIDFLRGALIPAREGTLSHPAFHYFNHRVSGCGSKHAGSSATELVRWRWKLEESGMRGGKSVFPRMLAAKHRVDETCRLKVSSDFGPYLRDLTQRSSGHMLENKVGSLSGPNCISMQPNWGRGTNLAPAESSQKLSKGQRL